VVAEETASTERNRWELYFLLIDAEEPIARDTTDLSEEKVRGFKVRCEEARRRLRSENRDGR